MFKVLWDNGHACDTLSETFDKEEDAQQAGEDWLAEMIAIDDDHVEAEEAYGFDVIEVPDDSKSEEEDADEYGELRKAALNHRGEP